MYYKNKRLITLRIPAAVMGQINCIVNHFSTEVSWFGDVSQDGDTITINRIYLFPQVVTGGTFRTDTPQVSELYDAWYETKLNEVANHYERTGESISIMQYNGHSHVNAGCTPSQEDVKFRNSREGLNIYSIHNKNGSVNWEIWTDDIVYEPVDINVVYIDHVFNNAEEYILKPVQPSYVRPSNYVKQPAAHDRYVAHKTITHKKQSDYYPTIEEIEDSMFADYEEQLKQGIIKKL